MVVPTFTPQKKFSVPKALIYVLAVVGIGIFVYFGGSVIKNFGSLGGKSALSVNVAYGDAEVYLNGELLGNTPYESQDLKSGENKVSIRGSDMTYSASIDFLPNSQVVMNRDLGISEVFSSGQNFWIEKGSVGSVLSVISEPSEAKVFVDNSEIGSTPFSIGTLTDGEYELRVEKVGYESQTSRIKIQKGYLLHVPTKLFPIPVPSKVNLLEDSKGIYDVYSNDPIVTLNISGWAEAVVHWNKSRGINLAGLGVNRDLVFDYLVDYQGNVYDRNGNLVEGFSSPLDASKVAYLRKESDGLGLSDVAKEVFENENVVVSSASGKNAKVVPTGTGWLNVRDAPGLDSAVLMKVNVGESFPVLEEKPGWIKIKASDSVDGWVSSSYVTVSETSP